METRKRIVLVDDSETVLLACRVAFEGVGFDVTTVAAPIGAPLVVLNTQPDAVVVDLGMATMPGERVVARLKTSSRMKHIPVFLFSDRPRSELQRIAQECGADGWVSKADGTTALTMAVLQHGRQREARNVAAAV